MPRGYAFVAAAVFGKEAAGAAFRLGGGSRAQFRAGTRARTPAGFVCRGCHPFR